VTRRVFTVAGIPAPQGSKKAFVRGKKAILVESSDKVKPWREAVAKEARQHFTDMNLGPVFVEITFYMPRPKTLPKGRTRPTVMPDLDKLARSTLDALTGIAYKDDAQVVNLVLAKYYPPGDTPGARIIIETEGPE
jgi:Holliday junction resolvase RusA-like endonuclease